MEYNILYLLGTEVGREIASCSTR